jgi:hypothetical protein
MTEHSPIFALRAISVRGRDFLPGDELPDPPTLIERGLATADPVRAGRLTRGHCHETGAARGHGARLGTGSAHRSVREAGMSGFARAERRGRETVVAKRPTEAGGLRLVYQGDRPDCVLAAVATVCGVTLDEIPAACSPGWHEAPGDVERIVFSWEDWFAARGFGHWHDAGRAPAFLDHWIALLPVPVSHAGRPDELHAVVMARDEILHDPGEWPKGTFDARDCQESLIVGDPGWVAEQAHRMTKLCQAGDPSVWLLNTPEGAMLRRMMEREAA